MAMPNLPAVLILSHEVTKESFGKKEKINTLKYENKHSNNIAEIERKTG